MLNVLYHSYARRYRLRYKPHCAYLESICIGLHGRRRSLHWEKGHRVTGKLPISM